MQNSEILLKYIEKQNVTCYKVAQSTGISESTFSKWKSSPTSKIDLSVVQKIAAYFGVSLSEILENNQASGVKPSLSQQEQDLLDNFNQLSEIDKTRVSERAETLAELATERAAEQAGQEKKEAVTHADPPNAPEELVLKSALTAPRTKKGTIKITYFDYSASAGTGLFLDETKSEKITVLNTFEAQNADYAIPVCGDSMEDEIHDGDIVLVESCPCVRKGEVGIFLLDGEVFIKEYGGDRLISYNEKYKPILLRKYEFAACLGRVLGIAQQVIK